jgi:hypothetical protein
MENSLQDAKAEQKSSQKKVGGVSKKSSNKPSGNPMGGRSRAKSTILATFEKNLKSNKESSDKNHKIQVEGFDKERFKNLKSMFEKKPEETIQDGQSSKFGEGKINPEKLKAFTGNTQNEETKKNSGLDQIKDAPRMSIKDRINMLMKSKDESQPKTAFNDPILEKLRETNLDEGEDSGDNYSEENLDISKEEDNNNEENALDRSESLSEEDGKPENIYDGSKEQKVECENKNEEGNNENDKENKKDLNKSESLEDD